MIAHLPVCPVPENNFGTRASPGFHLAQLGVVSAFLIELPAVHLLI